MPAATALVTQSEDVTIMDGGMGHQLKAMGIKIEGPVGSMRRFLGVALANHENPDLVRDAHLAFIDAGAQIIITNNYACVPKCLQHTPDGELSDITSQGIGKMVAKAGEIARQAVDLRPAHGVKVAGSLPPLAESYRADLVGAYEDNLKDYRTIVKAITPFSDVLICETMSTVDEARAAFTAAIENERNLPVWVSWTLKEKETVLRSGESIGDAVAALLKAQGDKKVLQGCFFNCTSPEIITKAIPVLKAALPAGIKIGAYANGFHTADSGEGEYRDLSGQEYYDDYVADWIKGGATIVGGCCGVFPRHITSIQFGLCNCEKDAKKPKVDITAAL